MEIKTFCPLGCQCETAKDGYIERCNWYQEIAGENPQTGESVSEKQCAIVLSPIMAIEQARQVRSVAAALESHRNVVASTGATMIQIEKDKLKAVGE